MPFIIADRVRESSTTTGTGNLTLAGAVVGFQTFDAVLDTGDTTFYVAADQGGPNWEVGIGTFTAPSTLARTTILSSSNGGSIVNFGAGTKDVFISLPASRTVQSVSGGSTGLTPSTDSVGAVTLGGTLAVGSGGTGATTAPNALTNLGAVAKIGDTMTGVLGIVPGTVSAPGLTFSGDTNTGIYSPGADTIAFVEGGVEALRINSNAQAEFSLGTVSLPSITATGDTNTGIFFPAADTVAIVEGGTEALRINSDAQAVFTAGTPSLPSITTTGDPNTGIFFPAADTVALVTNGAEDFRVGPAGQIGLQGANYGTSGQVLTSNGAAAAPSWQSPAGAGVTSFNTRTGAVTLSSGDVTTALGYTPFSTAGGSVSSGGVASTATATWPLRGSITGNALFGKALLLEAGGVGGDGPQVQFHKPGVRQWGVGIKNGSSEGDFFTFNVDGSNGTWGSQTVLFSPAGQVWTSNYGWLHDFFFWNIANCANCGGMTGWGPGNCPNFNFNYINAVNCFVVGGQLNDGGATISRSDYFDSFKFNCNCACNC